MIYDSRVLFFDYKKKIKEPPAAVNNQGQAKNTADNPDGDGKPARGIKRFLKRFNDFRKRIRPIRFFTRLIKKGLGSNKKKPTDDEEQGVEP